MGENPPNFSLTGWNLATRTAFRSRPKEQPSLSTFTAAATSSSKCKLKQSTASAARPGHGKESLTFPSRQPRLSLGDWVAPEEALFQNCEPNCFMPFPARFDKGGVTTFLLQQCPEPAARTASWRRPAAPGRSWKTSAPTTSVSAPSSSSSLQSLALPPAAKQWHAQKAAWPQKHDWEELQLLQQIPEIFSSQFTC